MRKIEDFDKVQEVEERQRLEEGPKVCVITKAEDVQEKEYLKIEFDIIEDGPFKGMFARISDNYGEWPSQGRMYRSYKTPALPYFKRFIVAVEKSNDGYTFDFNEQSLVGKKFVANFGIEEYDNGTEIVETIKVIESRSLQSLKEGKVQPPAAKRLPQSEHDKYKGNANALPDVGDGDIPF